MAGRKIVDEFTIHEDGRVTLAFGDAGKAYTLARPTLGQLRRFQETLLDLGRHASASEDASTIADAVTQGRLSLSIEERHDAEEALLAWWADVVKSLDENGGTFPDDVEAIPAWLLGPSLIPDLLNAWLSRPTPPGG